MQRKEYFTTNEAAKAMCCSLNIVYKLIKRKEIPVYKVGNRSYIPISAVDDYIRQHTIPAEEHISDGFDINSKIDS